MDYLRGTTYVLNVAYLHDINRLELDFTQLAIAPSFDQLDLSVTVFRPRPPLTRLIAASQHLQKMIINALTLQCRKKR